ncbi:triose-phosphate isomerase [Luteibaculum oceani]|uniref:Triosephosphate isomerase n=1 Tax=Luteibaculum oceani TaxID=1294296 RepID=A0A5C6UY44_9FLAO|nr:triose-phosphate isomerase [Luteibaculum oceani]TXC76976.1 triose-phosphate isomerase [Luteibaculum oceani]
MRKIVAGNWKMNMNYHEAAKLLDEIIISRSSKPDDVQLIIAPPAIYLSEFSSALRDLENISLAAQNVYHSDNGAYTGEISTSMLSSLGINYCIVGHSERRTLFKETDTDVNLKVKSLLKDGIQPIICIGELLHERENETHFQVIEKQILAALEGLSEAESAKVLWAYEPVWAIGTGKTASAEQAQEMHAFIRKILSENGFNTQTPILYGGSCKPGNAKEIFGGKDVNGGLIGGASLKANDFLQIANSF